MAYLGKGPEQVLSGVASKSTFTGDGSTTTFDISTDIPAGGENDIQVFVDNVRQEPGSGASYTVGVDGSGNLRRITFNVAPEASQSIYVINPRRLEAFGQVPDNSIATAKVQDTSITTAKITDLNVTTGKIAADAITEAKIADNAISEEHLDTTVVTGLTSLGAGAATNDTLIIYDTSSGTLKKITQQNFLNFPTISSVSPTSATSGDGTGNYTFTITGTGFTGSSASLINTSGSGVAFDTVTVDSDTQITGVIAKSSLPGSGEPYDVKVTAATGLSSTLENQINIDQSPTYNTASGSLGTVVNGAVGSTTLTVEAYDPESAGNVTFEIQSGSLPAGATATTVNENGVSKYQISGFSAVGSNTTSNFVIRASDTASNTSSRSFSITVNAPVSESFTTSGTFSVPSGITSADVLVVAGGGGGGGHGGNGYKGGGAGAGGLIFMPEYPVTPGGTITVTVGDGGSGGSNNPTGQGSQTIGNPGNDSVFGSPGDPGLGQGGVLTAQGGGAGGGGSCNGQATGGSQGGSGGGAGSSQNNAASQSTGTQPTQPGNSGAYGFGNGGGNANSPGPGWGAGGGGAGGAGQPASCTAQPGVCSTGGAGKSYTIADGTSSVTYAGGGTGGGRVPASATDSQPGTANRGGGGNGGGSTPGGGPGDGGNGGKGIVIVRY
jgi:hypothetical protein